MISEILRSVYVNRRNKQSATFKPKGFFDVVKRSFRVGLTDIDFNMHINNSRYMIFMERSRWDHMVQIGMWDFITEEQLNPIIAGIEMSYIREIRCFKRFDLETSFIGWDEKYFYMEQRFVINQTIHAYGLVKAVFMKQGKLVTPSVFFSKMNIDVLPDALPEHVELWKKMGVEKRAYSSQTISGDQ